MKKTILAAALILFISAVSAVGFTQTEDIPNEFSGGESFEIETTLQNDEGEVPVLFQLKASDENGRVPVEAFDLDVKDSDLDTEPAPCSFGDIFDRNVCAYSQVPEGEYDATLEVSSATNLAPGEYNLSIQLLSLEGDVYLGELFQYWGDPRNISRGEASVIQKENIEVEIRPEAPGEDGTEEAWIHVEDLENVHQEGPGEKQFVRGAQVLVNQDLAEKSGVENITGEDIFGNTSSEDEETGGGIDTALVLDRSGSMEGEKIKNVKIGAKNYVNSTKTSQGDRNAIVGFESDYRIVQPLTGNRSKARDSIDTLIADGGTDHEDAVIGGHTALNESSRSNRVMIVLGDGCGGDATEEAQNARQNGIDIHVIIYGDNACTDELESMLPEGQICEDNPNSTENRDGDQCWYSSTENISQVFGDVQEQIDTQYLKNATEDQLFGGDTGQVDANGSIRFEFETSEYVPATASIYRWNNSLEGEEPQGWVEIEDQATGGEIKAEVEEFSTFALFAESAPPEQSSGGGGGGGSLRTIDPEFDAIMNGLEVEFEDDTQTYGTEIGEYRWEFGDGENATGEQVTHEYGEPGTYEVTLKLQADNLQHIGTEEIEVVQQETEVQEQENEGEAPQQEEEQEEEQEGDDQAPEQQEGPGQQPQGPTGLFAAGVPDLFQGLADWISGIIPF